LALIRLRAARKESGTAKIIASPVASSAMAMVASAPFNTSLPMKESS